MQSLGFTANEPPPCCFSSGYDRLSFPPFTAYIPEVKTIHNVSLEKLASECKALGIHVNQIAKSLNTRQVNYKYMDNDEFLTTFQAVKCVPEITSKVSELIEKIEASRKDFIVDVDAEVEKGIDNYVYGQRALTDRYQEENNYGND